MIVDHRATSRRLPAAAGLAATRSRRWHPVRMAFSAHKDPEMMKETQEPEDVVDRKAQRLAQWIKDSKHMIAFTGAGVSTSAGIPDFRGPEGVWTLQASGGQRTSKTVSSLQAVPTPSHMSLVALASAGKLKYLVSQNTDGLHRKSGIPPFLISELHGNTNREYCKNCGKEYIRDYSTGARNADLRDHSTGRRCGNCGGKLYDTIIHFSESLPREPLRKAFEHAEKADLCLVLGSSLTVTPAADIPRIVGEKPGARLVICNLQRTPLDPLAGLRVFAKTDDLMVRVMKYLDIELPSWNLQRRLIVETGKPEGDQARTKIKVYGVDEEGTPVSFLRAVQLGNGVAAAEPFEMTVRGLKEGQEVPLELRFMGWYGEPVLKLRHKVPPPDRLPCKTLYRLGYDPHTGIWTANKEGEDCDGSAPWAQEGTHDDVEKAHDQAKPKPGWVPEGAAASDPSLAANLKPSDGE